MSHTHVAAQTPRLLCELSLRCDGGTSESCSRPKGFRIRALRAHPPTLLLTSAFGIAASWHRNSARHMEKFVVQRNKFVCSNVISETFNQLIQKERVSPRRYLPLLISKGSGGHASSALATLRNIVQYSHGSVVTPSTPQFEHVILERCMLDDISEIIEQK